VRWIISSGMVEVKFDELIEERGASICVLVDGRRLWLPKGQVDFRRWSSIVEVPEWLAREKGLI